MEIPTKLGKINQATQLIFLKALKNNLKQSKLLNYAMSIVAGIINAIGVALFLIPAKLIDGGISGTSFLISVLSSVHVSVFIVALNLPFFLLGFKKQGFAFIVHSLISIGFYSLFTFLLQSVFFASNYLIENPKQDMFLCSVFGGLISGIGSGLAIRSGGAMDGVEVMAVLFSKKIGLSVGQFVMVYNVIQYVIACFVLSDMRIGLFSIIAYAVGVKAVDFVVEGFDRTKACFIITQKADVLGKAISTELRRGITLIDSKGFYSNEDRTMMYCVVNRFEIHKVKKLVNSIDTTAFVTISDVSEIMGTWVKYSSSYKAPDKDICDTEPLNVDAVENAEYTPMQVCASQNDDVIIGVEAEKQNTMDEKDETGAIPQEE